MSHGGGYVGEGPDEGRGGSLVGGCRRPYLRGSPGDPTGGSFSPRNRGVAERGPEGSKSGSQMREGSIFEGGAGGQPGSARGLPG